MTKPCYPLLFRPVLKDYLWGGRNLETRLGRRLPAEGVVAESWEIAATSTARRWSRTALSPVGR